MATPGDGFSARTVPATDASSAFGYLPEALQITLVKSEKWWIDAPHTNEQNDVPEEESET